MQDVLLEFESEPGRRILRFHEGGEILCWEERGGEYRDHQSYCVYLEGRYVTTDQLKMATHIDKV